MDDAANPLIPTSNELLVYGIWVALLVPLVVAVLMLAWSRVVTGRERLGLLLVCLCLPLLGSVLTLMLLHRRRKQADRKQDRAATGFPPPGPAGR